MKPLTEAKRILKFINNWQAKNKYNPRLLKEHNRKFTDEFHSFLDTNGFSKETIQCYKTVI